jgi:DNA-directed RNA polymerase delta subunit
MYVGNMSEHIIQTISDLEKKVQEYESNALRVKTTINELCGMAGIPKRYNAGDLELPGVGFKIRSDQFHARPLATIVREYLEMRKRADLGPATLDDIFGALAQGGYESDCKTEAIAKTSLYNSISKNSNFYKLPNKQWGLAEWYPNAKKKPIQAATEDDNGDPSEIGSAQVEENRQRRENDLAAQQAADRGE